MMEETDLPLVQQDNCDDHEEEDFDDMDRPLERWAPLGAAMPDWEGEQSHVSELDRLCHLEDEQEELNQSLLSLTTHFGQVQFRLKQIISASPEEIERLLKELEEFAFRGCPDTRGIAVIHPDQDTVDMNEKEHESRIAEQRKKQLALIEQLKQQLQDLENYAYQTGDAGMPQNMVMEKQRVIIDELKQKLKLDMENMEQLDTEQLKQKVNMAVSQIVNPAKAKEQLVSQLKTQIIDLERFIEFLQKEAERSQVEYRCTCPAKGNESDGTCCMVHNRSPRHRLGREADSQKHVNERTAKMVKRMKNILQMLLVNQFGCASMNNFRKNELKKTTKGNHWGDMRARLELAVDYVIQLTSAQEQHADSDYTSDDDAPAYVCNEALVSAVRKDLAGAIRDLMQHGLMEIGQSRSLVPFVSCAHRPTAELKAMHAWELLLKYYELKDGPEYNATPARKLSQSFDLSVVGGTAITSKQMLLGAIDNVLASHMPYKRSMDSQFKAFICAALNAKKLVVWLRLLFRTQYLTNNFYQPWSYVTKTGFEDAFRLLQKLSTIDFNLPTDLAVRQFQNIKHAF
ncbi:PREDICTED: RUN domain-containing protein 1-like isoform X1 [Priapulus caudatus]|uniref:RUN domain-containing protein 1-like isoform X1 n=1 Tax=Priapulus caudatus TaxID=37621 RepID=A0ABM1ESI4_PRICU|nr:PREDICTED: RUN domain-containing protein 1-like isoform X1 [Priapulus caudatus]XP_014675155.1 PREDICTED: RUN domain-containing protein 1-like isoform X1 [Priapulus caudatus]